MERPLLLKFENCKRLEKKIARRNLDFQYFFVHQLENWKAHVECLYIILNVLCRIAEPFGCTHTHTNTNWVSS